MEYLTTDRHFSHLSLVDLLAARDQFHAHLMHKRTVRGDQCGGLPQSLRRSISDAKRRPASRSQRGSGRSEAAPHARELRRSRVLVAVRDGVRTRMDRRGPTYESQEFVPSKALGKIDPYLWSINV